MKTNRKTLLLLLMVIATILTGCATAADIPTIQNGESSVLSSQNEVDIPSITNSIETPPVSPTPEPTDVQDVLTISEISVPDIVPISVNTSEPSLQQTTTGELKIAFLDVGQGDSICISLPNGETILIDAGESFASSDIIQYLKDNNISTINHIIATHPHSDHIGGMAAIINAFEVQNVWMPDTIHNTKTFENLLDTIDAKGLSIQIAKTGTLLFDYGNLKAEFIAPCGSGYSNLNNYSAAILLTYNNKNFLFMGDAEKESETEILATKCDISADVLKVGHHGSSSSSTKSFVQTVSPKYAILSCGEGNSYGHPSSQTLAVLNDYNVEILRTDESGTITFICDGDNISYSVFKTEVQPRAPTSTATLTPEATVTPTPTVKPEESIATQGSTVYITKTGSKYHSDGCRYLSKSKIEINLESARKKYDPCSVCNPPK